MNVVDIIRGRLVHDLDAEGVRASVRFTERSAGADLVTEDGRPADVGLDLGVGFGWVELGLASDDDPEELVALVADHLQDDLAQVELLHWPTCPGHPHPAVVRITDEGATWACPRTEAHLARIGDVPNRTT